MLIDYRLAHKSRKHQLMSKILFTGRLVIEAFVVGGFLVVRRLGPFVGRTLNVLGNLVVVVVGAAVGAAVAVTVGNRCGRFVGNVVNGRCVLTVVTDDGRLGNVLFSTISAKSWKLSFSDSTILFTNKPILSFSKSSSMNCGVEMS